MAGAQPSAFPWRPSTFKAQTPLGLTGRGVRAAPTLDPEVLAASAFSQLCCRFYRGSAFKQRQFHGESSRNHSRVANVNLHFDVQMVWPEVE